MRTTAATKIAALTPTTAYRNRIAVARAQGREDIVVGEVDLEYVKELRRRLPTLELRRPDDQRPRAAAYMAANSNAPNAVDKLQYSTMKPTPISEKEVQNIMQQMQAGVEKPRPKVLFEVGEAVRVKEGPFTDFHGLVEDVNYDKSKLRVSVTIFGRATPVELEFGQVEKA